MVRNRKGLAPWSLAREAGIQSATVDGTIEVPQYVQPTLSTGFVDEKGDWKGAKSSDREFIAIEIQAGIANSGVILAPTSANADGSWPLNMDGYNDLLIAIKPTNGGTYQQVAIMGPDTESFANLSPVDSGTALRIADDPTSNAYTDILNDTNETLAADVWNIFSLPTRCKGQKLLQFKITNSSGGESDIETAFMRIV